jgi:hypothetical protein
MVAGVGTLLGPEETGTELLWEFSSLSLRAAWDVPAGLVGVFWRAGWPCRAYRARFLVVVVVVVGWFPVRVLRTA